MQNDRCILCGQPYSTGLHILGCLICFPCEHTMLHKQMPRNKRRRLLRIYDAAEQHAARG